MNNEIPEEFAEEEEAQSSVVVRIFQGVVALLVAIGLIYISGVYQYFLYQKTPAEVQQVETQAVVKEEILMLPLSVFILRNDGGGGSSRPKDDVSRLVENASQVWNQAQIELGVENIYEVEVSDEEITLFLDEPREFIVQFDLHDPSFINVFLVGNLRGINGLSFGGTSVVAVADYTTVYDFRVLAHEVGHALELAHVPEDQGRLMYQGANGVTLTMREIEEARKAAADFQ